MGEQSVEEWVASVPAAINKVPAKEYLFHPGDACNHFVYVVSGRVRVDMLSPTGQQILLYRIHEGESCIMTTACLLGNNEYSVQAVSETELEIALISKTEFLSSLNQSETIRNFVFDGFCSRISDVVSRMNEIATMPIDQRLASVLLEHYSAAKPGEALRLTHEGLAVEVGTAREVISRRLAVFEKQGLLQRSRGYISILDHARLREII